jgi:hypothetical protein
MFRFYFASGKTQLADGDWEKLVPKLLQTGIKVYKADPNTLIPLTSNTIEMIKYEEPECQKEPETPKTEPVKTEEEVVPTPVIEEKEPKKMTDDEYMKKVADLSSCTHTHHDLYFQETLVGRAKKPAKRYFPVCSTCGLRERYVKADSLSDEEKENAKVWNK